MRRTLAHAYGFGAYLLALGTIAYAVGFLANVAVPTPIDSGTTGSVGTAAAVNVALLGLFGLQHSLMARPWFKDAWTRLVPAPVERSTYVLLASLALLVMMVGWQPLTGDVWRVEGPLAWLLWTGFAGGWLLMLASVYQIDKDDLMGLAQVRAYRAGRPYKPPDFQTPALYRRVRHPLMTGFLLAFWSTPRMTVGHQLFAAGMTAYVVVGVTLEERDLVATFGDRYRTYRAAVPAFVPRPGQSAPPELVEEAGSAE